MINRIVKIVLVFNVFFIDVIYRIVEVSSSLLEKLDSDVRTNIYIGVTGILVAIVIFIAQIVSDKKIEIYKRLMLEKTQIEKNVQNMIITMVIIWIGGLIKVEYSKTLYILVQIITDVMIIYSMIRTLKLFFEVIKLNTNKEYFDEELKKYVYDKVEKNIEAKKQDEVKLNNKNREFDSFISKSRVFKFNSSPFILGEEYSALESNKYGYIDSYNYYILNKIEENLNIQIRDTDNRNTSSENVTNIHPEIYICKKIGEKCGNEFPIAYYKDVKKELINMVNKAIIINIEEHIDYDKEIEKILDDIFVIASQSTFKFDNEDMLLNLYNYICKNKYESIITTFLDKVYYMHKKINKNIDENISFSKFLIRLLNISFKNNRYEDFKKINLYITGLYINRMKYEGTDLKEVAYRYSNDVFLFNNYSIKRKSDYRYYDIIMSNLLIIIKEYLKRDNIDSILVIFNNIHFEKSRYGEIKEFNDYDIINFQFIIAIIYFILYLYKKRKNDDEKTNKSFIEDVKRLIDKLNYRFFELYDMWDTILKFSKYSEKQSEIYHIIETIDLDNENHKYKNSWTYNPIDIHVVLKSLIYMFDISYVNIDKIDKSDIKREEEYKYERLIELFENPVCAELEEEYEYNIRYKDNVIKLLSKVKEIAKAKEIEYEANAKLSTEKIDIFKKIAIKSSEDKSDIEEIIYKLGKIKESNEKLNITFGISELIPRNWFIYDNNIFTDNIAKDFGESFKRGIKKEIINYIIQNSIVKEETLENIINNLQNIDDYILLANRTDLYKLGYRYNDRYLTINDKRIRVLVTFEIEDFIIINEKALPYIELCKFGDNYNIECVDGNIYIEIMDCSNNKQLRNIIIKNSSWLKEKGNIEEQNNYLKTMCDFKMFKSYKIVESEIKESYIIKK